MILRSWRRSALSSTISLLSLTIGLLCSTILLLFAVTEFRMAKTLGKDPNVYFVEQFDWFEPELEIFRPTVEKELVAEIADNYPEVLEWTVIGQHPWKWDFDEKVLEEGPFTISVTPSFTKFVTIPMETGSLDSILKHPDAIAITRSYANLIFPNEDPIGKIIKGKQQGSYNVEGVEYSEERSFVVEGIIDDSFNSFLNMRAIFLRTEDQVRSTPCADDFSAMIKLNTDVDPEDFIDIIYEDSVLYDKYWLDEQGIQLRKLSNAYFGLQPDNESLFKTRNKNTLIIGFTIALIVLIISAFNYLNITLIRAPKRLKNLAGQRIMGASKREIAGQVIAETTLNIIVAFGFALIFMPSAMELFNSFMGSDLQWQHLAQWNNLPYTLLLLSVLIIIPALFLISKFTIKQPMEVFKNSTGNKIHYFGGLVVLQLIISVVLIAFSINVKRQMDYIVDTVPDAHQIICVESDGWWMSQDFIDHVRESSSTVDYLSGSLHPNSNWTDDEGVAYLFRETQANYFEFLNIPVVRGRVFDNASTEIIQVVSNKAFIRKHEIEEDPLGYEFEIFKNKFRVVGVCEDFNTKNAASIVSPTLYRYTNGNYAQWNFNIRFSGSLEDKINEIKEIFEKYAVPDELGKEPSMPKISTMADFYINLNPEVKRLRIIVEFFAFISIFLSAMGLFGLSWYTVERRHKEIALRKIHGSSTGKLLLLLCKTFFLWCAIATIIALPIGYYISKYWLEGFVYRMDNSLWALALTALIAAAVTFLTVIFQTARAALANPAKYIKME